MARPHLPLNALRAFEAAARHQNLTRAALELHVSQAALSHQIRKLEDGLGIRLFHRLPRGVALSEEAVATLTELGYAVSSHVAPDMGHGISEAMLDHALDFVRDKFA